MTKNISRLYESEMGKDLEFLSYLFQSEAFLSIKEMSQQFGLTLASVPKYLERMQTIIEEFGEPGIGIIANEQGYQFYTQTIQQYYHLRNHIIHSAITVQLGFSLLLGKNIQREQFMMAHFISEATLKRRVRELRSFFLEYHLNLNFRNGILVLKGDELQIRRLAYELLNELYLEGRWPFETIDEEIVSSRIEVYLGTEETPANAHLFRKVKLDYGVMISRFRNQYPLKFNFSLVEPKLYQAMMQMVPKLSPFPEIPNDHAAYFVMTLLSNEAFYQTPNGQQALMILEESETQIVELVHYSKQTFCQIFEIEATFEEMLPYLYSIHFEKIFYRYWRGLAHKPPIATPYPMLNRKLIQYMIQLQKSYPKLLQDPLYSFIRKYLILYGRYHPCSKEELPIHIYLSDDNFPSQSELLRKIFGQMFLYKFKLVFVSLKEADLVIRTTSASPPPRLAKQASEVGEYYLNVSKLYQNYEHLDKILQNIANEKILLYNEGVFLESQTKNIFIK